VNCICCSPLLTHRTDSGSGSNSRSFSIQSLIPFQTASKNKKKVGAMSPATTVTAPTVKPISRLTAGDSLPDDYVDDDPTKTGPERRAGILLHPTSLPGSYGIGELGDEALHFLDWLKGAGCTVWQVPTCLIPVCSVLHSLPSKLSIQGVDFIGFYVRCPYKTKPSFFEVVCEDFC
jgi:hypothetical protein